MAKTNLDCQVRSESGKAATRRMRSHLQMAPGIIYGNKEDNISVMMDQKKLYHACEHESFFSQIIELNVTGKKIDVVVRDVQRHPYRQQIVHIDFMRVTQTSEITLNVPLHFTNAETSIGVKQQGGKVFHELNEVAVSCLPKNLPEFIAVDVAELQLGESLHLSDLKVPTGVTLTELARGEEHNVAVVRISKVALSDDAEDQDIEELPDSPEEEETD